jgi:hypothetical protein
MPAPTFFKKNQPIPDESWNIIQLSNAFDALVSQTDAHKRVDREKMKLLIMQIVEQKIKKEMSGFAVVRPMAEKSKQGVMQWLSKQALYLCLLSFGVFENTATSYFFGFTLFSLIPALSNPILMIAAAIYTVLEGVLFYIYEASLLEVALGVSQRNWEPHRLIKLYTEQLQISKQVNQRLTSIPILVMKNDVYDAYVKFTGLMNKDLQVKCKAASEAESSILRRIIKAAVLLFGAVSSVAGSYFLVIAMMSILAAPLVGTPVGWCIILLTVVAGLGYHYAMGTTSMSRVLSSDYDQFQTLKKEWAEFQETYSYDLSKVQTIKHRFKEKKEEGVSTQGRAANEPIYASKNSFFGRKEGLNDDKNGLDHAAIANRQI